MFRLESQMTSILVAKLRDIISSVYKTAGRHALAKELPLNSRVVDMAVAPVNEDVFSSNPLGLSELKKLNQVELDILSLFTDGPVSIHKLSERTFLTASVLKTQFLDRFLSLNLIRKKSRYTYEATEWSQALPPDIITIEAKLEKWREALDQAIYNLRFSNIALVVLDIERFQERCTPFFKKAGVGLLLLENDGSFRVAVKPRVHELSCKNQNFQRIRVLRDIQTPKSSKWSLSSMY